ncbi:MAG: prepilin-type N-terminal cleavage/methylation domain-containing protein [Candidatus Omnitrophota bacterium]|nr:prepilin-type N-terminal cleavage/methylation domain-containing protein [Candidatus Omnitrophota bacterium]
MLRRKGFTLVEIMIVVAIIGLLAAIAIPNFVKARTTAEKQACIANLKQIQGAVQIWALDTGALETATPTTGQLAPDYIKVWPKCGGTAYVVPAVDAEPVCPKKPTEHYLVAPAA